MIGECAAKLSSERLGLAEAGPLVAAPRGVLRVQELVGDERGLLDPSAPTAVDMRRVIWLDTGRYV